LIVLSTMDELPERCCECPLSHEGWCYGTKDEKHGWGAQSTQEIRPYNCPLKKCVIIAAGNEPITMEQMILESR